MTGVLALLVREKELVFPGVAYPVRRRHRTGGG